MLTLKKLLAALCFCAVATVACAQVSPLRLKKLINRIEPYVGLQDRDCSLIERLFYFDAGRATPEVFLRRKNGATWDVTYDHFDYLALTFDGKRSVVKLFVFRNEMPRLDPDCRFARVDIDRKTGKIAHAFFSSCEEGKQEFVSVYGVDEGGKPMGKEFATFWHRQADTILHDMESIVTRCDGEK